MRYSTISGLAVFVASAFLLQPAWTQPQQSPDAPVTNALLQKLEESEREALQNYRHRSNNVRDRVVTLMGEPDTEAKKAQMLSLSHELHELDESLRPVVEKLIRNGYWVTGGPRDNNMDMAVWLVLQHIFDKELVEITLEQTLPLVQTGAFSGRQYATMYDRMEITEDRKQKFGTQTRCVDGRWQLWPLEEPDKVDDYRQAFGFKSTLAEEEAQYGKRSCGTAGGG